ncbi:MULTISPECIES: hypothetical protein [Vitreoscilla]|uniref:Uncharacterized protein n=1 Tax=Vitreoscilla stercoraria TaxID=61 RepID=A0ABY4E8J4_VITST|nr:MULTISPECIES: hypothetical protein [Vitreoscilla]AUZ04538.2 hypothetical protein ADP71_07890 [Vitreoscilla sp. C1]UOO91754.1 hypothetical protein LVJ81_08925 [Vitreoscilla stercoraria]
MASTILEILQTRVQTLGNNIVKTESKISLIQEQLQQNQIHLTQAQQDGDLTLIRECLSKQQILQEAIPPLQKTLANIQKSHRLFERQLQQNSVALTK